MHSENGQHAAACQLWHTEMMQSFGAARCERLPCYSIPKDFLLTVVIPVFNEQATLSELMEIVCKVPLRKEIIVVDDGSSDQSPDIVKKIKDSHQHDSRNQIVLLENRSNCGKGQSVRTGFQHASGNIVLIQDADLEYDPVDYPCLLRPIIEGQADVVYGSRFAREENSHTLDSFHYLGNKFLTAFSNVFTDLNLTDMETGYKAFTRQVVADIGPQLKQQRFGFEPEVTARIARRGYRVSEVPIRYSGRTYQQGKKISWRDGLIALWCIVRYAITS